jgi:hypothetical protein
VATLANLSLLIGTDLTYLIHNDDKKELKQNLTSTPGTATKKILKVWGKTENVETRTQYVLKCTRYVLSSFSTAAWRHSASNECIRCQLIKTPSIAPPFSPFSPLSSSPLVLFVSRRLSTLLALSSGLSLEPARAHRGRGPGIAASLCEQGEKTRVKQRLQQKRVPPDLYIHGEVEEGGQGEGAE